MFANADFYHSWDDNFADVDPAIAKSQSGLFITYAGCPILWVSKSKTHVATSTTMTEYVDLSSALRDVIPILELLEEFMEHTTSFLQNCSTIIKHLKTTHCNLPSFP